MTEQSRTETLGVRVTPEQRRKIIKLSEIRDRPYADFLREAVEDAVEEYDRAREKFSVVEGSS